MLSVGDVAQYCLVQLGGGLTTVGGRMARDALDDTAPADNKLLWKERHRPLLTAIALVALIAAALLPYTSHRA